MKTKNPISLVTLGLAAIGVTAFTLSTSQAGLTAEDASLPILQDGITVDASSDVILLASHYGRGYYSYGKPKKNWYSSNGKSCKPPKKPKKKCKCKCKCPPVPCATPERPPHCKKCCKCKWWWKHGGY